jgi:syntaxin 16
MKTREDKSAHFFEFDDVGDPTTEALDRQWNKQDVLFVADNSKFIQQREKEIHSIVQSISDLNVIFKELATMVTEQVR